jgi:hypothetical protein
MTKRIWIRAHELFTVSSAAEAMGKHDDMVVIEVPNELADYVMSLPFTFIRGKVLADDESVPYVGPDPPHDG